MVIISRETIEDVATFYANALLAHPNTWTQEDVDNHIENTIRQMESVIIESIKDQRAPLLQHLNDGETIELKTKNNKWYFSVRIENGNTLIENAWYYANASNRAYRRGQSNPNAPLSQDDRSNQVKRKITENQLRQIISEVVVDGIKPRIKTKKVGKYTAVDGDWWDGYPPGLDWKGCGLQDVRMYDRSTEKKIDTIALYRRCDNRRFFYAKIVHGKDGELEWKAIPLSEVPMEIRRDFKTINPEGHEPISPF